MLELLRDGIWTFIGAILALAAVGSAFWIYILQTPRKRLLVEKVARVPLVTVGADRVPGLELRYKGDRIQSATVIVVRVENIGNRPITEAEFERPLTLSFEAGAIVLHAEVSEKIPNALDIRTEADGQELKIAKCLLNPGDTFLCRTLVRDSSGLYEPSARVVGLKDLETSRPISLTRQIAMITCVIIIFIAYFLSPAPASSSIKDYRTEELPYLLAMMGGMMALTILTAIDIIKERMQIIRDRLQMVRLQKQDL